MALAIERQPSSALKNTRKIFLFLSLGYFFFFLTLYRVPVTVPTLLFLGVSLTFWRGLAFFSFSFSSQWPHSGPLHPINIVILKLEKESTGASISFFPGDFLAPMQMCAPLPCNQQAICMCVYQLVCSMHLSVPLMGKE